MASKGLTESCPGDGDHQGVRPEDLVAELRRFILSFGEHDLECPSFEAVGAAAVSPDECECGFIPRMEELLALVQARIATMPP